LKGARCVGGKGKVVAFEPAPILFTLASYHQRINGLRQLEIIPQAVSDQDSDGALFYILNDGMSYRNSLTIGSENVPFVTPGEKKALKVPATTLDTFISNTGLIPTLIKIDVEGAELLVLKGAQQLLDKYHPDLILAIHPYWLPSSHSADQIFTFLSRYGYGCTESHIVWMDNMPVGDYLFSRDGAQG
jgi:FkbM family methyltransferase